MANIESIGLLRLHTEEDFYFMKIVNEAAQDLPVTGSTAAEGIAENMTADLTKYVNQFTASFRQFDEALKKTKSIPEDKLVADADEERDKAWRCSYNFVKAMVMHPDEGVAASAQTVQTIYDKYGNPTKLSQHEEGGILNNLIPDLEAVTAENRKALNFDPWLEWLKSASDDFDMWFKERNNARGTYVRGQVQESRDATDEAYRQLVDRVNAHALINGEEKYISFINQVNENIIQLKSNQKLRSTNSMKKKGEEAADELLDPTAPVAE